MQIFVTEQDICILGGASATGEHLARLLVSSHKVFYLTGRDMERLGCIAKDLRVRGAAQVVVEQLDLTDTAITGVVARARDALGGWTAF